MLKSELQQLELLVGEVVNYNETPDPKILQKDLGNTLPRIKEACGHLRLKWVRELFSNVKEPVIHRYVQFHQAGIISLSDHITDSYPHLTGDGFQKLFMEIVDQLEELLNFLKNSFYKYFDPEHAVSVHQCHQETEKISYLISLAEAEMKKAGIEDSLVLAVQRSITDVLEQAPHNGISHRRIAYIKTLIQLVRDQIETGQLTSESLVSLLYRQNFNSFYFERWYQQRTGQSNRLDKPKEFAAACQNELHKLEDQFIDLNKTFDVERPSLDILFTGWLLLQLSKPQEFPDNVRRGATEPIRMPLNFSVTQFALFIRLCYLEGCFNLNNISSIHRFFTSHFETKKQLHISAKSFGRAFYSADQPAAAVVRDVLMRMVGTIDKTYFPK